MVTAKPAVANNVKGQQQSRAIAHPLAEGMLSYQANSALALLDGSGSKLTASKLTKPCFMGLQHVYKCGEI